MSLIYLFNVNNNKRIIIPQDYNIGEYIRNNFNLFGISETDIKMMPDMEILKKALKNGWVKIVYDPDSKSLSIDHHGLQESKLKEMLKKINGVSVSLNILFNDISNHDNSFSIQHPQQIENQYAKVIKKIITLSKKK